MERPYVADKKSTNQKQMTPNQQRQRYKSITRMESVDIIRQIIAKHLELPPNAILQKSSAQATRKVRIGTFMLAYYLNKIYDVTPFTLSHLLLAKHPLRIRQQIATVKKTIEQYELYKDYDEKIMQEIKELRIDQLQFPTKTLDNKYSSLELNSYIRLKDKTNPKKNIVIAGHTKEEIETLFDMSKYEIIENNFSQIRLFEIN